jgi:hypothetical protein
LVTTWSVPLEPRVAYAPRDPEKSLWNHVLREHLLTFLERARDPDDASSGVPAFVERELRAVVGCGSFALGFLRIFCPDCKFHTRVPFSCQGRAACPSCSARRMFERAANLVDHVVPDVEIRQWVVTPPFELRGLLLADLDFMSAFIRIVASSIFRHIEAKARGQGVEDGQCGAVTFIQRWSSALGVFPHLHVLALDGVYSKDGEDAPVFHAVSAATERDEVRVSAHILGRVAALLHRRRLIDPDASSERPLTPLEKWYARALAERARFSIVSDDVGVAREGKSSGRPPSTGEIGGFSVHARVAVRRGDKAGRERLARYCGRPPFAESQLTTTEEGRIAFALSRPRWSGETHVIFEPLQLIRRIAWMVPPAKQHQVRFHGALAPAARIRPHIIPAPRVFVALTAAPDNAMPEPSATSTHRIDWARLLARVGIDALACPQCGGRMRVLAAITEPTIILRILEHLGLPTEPPSLSRPRAPP